jgi:hypothetical protein
MINSKPNNKRYHQGNFIPKNKTKVLKLNDKGGLYYRSGLELKFMTWLDMNEKVISWGSENLRIPYQMTHFENGDVKIKEHSYFPDFYYEMRINGVLSQVVVEVKPQKEYEMVLKLNEGKLDVPENKLKKLKNFEYSLKMAYKNKNKWETMVKWCDKKGYNFIVVTEETFKRKG